MDIGTSVSLSQTAPGTGGLDPSVWVGILAAVLLFFLVYSLVLIFHWFSFSMRGRTAVMATVLYVAVSAVFLFSMFTSVVTLFLL